MAMKQVQRTLGFRLDPSNRERLDARAKKVGVSPGELAREIIIEALDDDRELDRLRLKVSAVEEEVTDLRRDLSVAVQALLVASGKVTPDQAQEWVHQNMKKR